MSLDLLADADFTPSGISSRRPPQVEVWNIDANDLDPDASDSSLLSGEEWARMSTLACHSDRRLYLAAHLSLRAILARRLSATPGELVFERSPCPRCRAHTGRPILVSPSRRVATHFSLSHDGQRVAIMVGDAEVGIDIQRIPRRVEGGLMDLLHPAEQLEIVEGPVELRSLRFAQVWSRKEAYLKAIGTGLAHGVGSAFCGHSRFGDTPDGWDVRDLPTAEGYVAAVVTPRLGGATQGEPVHL